MKKPHVQFLLISFVISYLCFGLMMGAQTPFGVLMANPLYVLLFGLGCLGPLIATVAVYILHKQTLGGLPGLLKTVKTILHPKTIYLVLLFLAAHYGFAVVLRVVGGYGSFGNFLLFIPIMLLLFGSQEVGWRVLAQPGLEEARGFWKSSFAVGLLQALWFLPLLFVEGFVVGPDFFLQFTAYILGYSLLSITIYRKSGAACYSVLYTTLFFALSVLFALKLSNMVVAIAAVDFVLAFLYNSKTFIKGNE